MTNQDWEEMEVRTWEKVTKVKRNVRKSKEPVLFISDSKKYLTFYVDDVIPRKVSIYTYPRGKGNGIDVAFVPEKGGEFTIINKAKPFIGEDYCNGGLVHCSYLLNYLKAKSGRYDLKRVRVHNQEGWMFTTFPEKV